MGAGSLALGGLAQRAGASEPGRAELGEEAHAPEPYFTEPDDFRDVSRGTPLPHSLPQEKKRDVGLTRETWKLEVLADPEQPTKLRRPMAKSDGTALDFADLVALGEKHAVRFAKVMTCLNIGCPLGMGIWEGVPLREIVWRTEPRADLRRIVYHGYHNDDPKQLFRSSLPAGRVLEDPHDLPPVILCYKLNGRWLDSRRGGPVRMVVPEAYGFKSIKWLTHVFLSNLPHANDTYASGNNDVDSPLKTFAATLSVPRAAKPGQPIPVTGYAQVGISGLSKVQVWLAPADTEWPSDDEYFQAAPWIDAEILPPPAAGAWGGGLPDGRVPAGVRGFDDAGRPLAWPMRLAKAHWSARLPGLAEGKYILRCRSIDANGVAQPMPRPFAKSGHAAIESVPLRVSS